MERINSFITFHKAHISHVQLVNEQGLVDYAPYIALKTVQGQVVPWTPSVSDVLAEDWMVI